MAIGQCMREAQSILPSTIQYSILRFTEDNYGLSKGADLRFIWAFPVKMTWQKKYWPTLRAKQTERHNRGVNKEMSSVFVDQYSALVYESKCWGIGGACGVSANEYSCEYHVTWSPNKLWRSTSIFNLWAQCLQFVKPWDIFIDKSLSFLHELKKSVQMEG